jgi:hypothetical protein
MKGNKLAKSYTNKLAGILFVIFNLLTITIEMLVLLKILPYDIIGGGLLANYTSAFHAIIFSILILAIETVFIIVVEQCNKSGKTNLFIKIILGAIFLLLCINLVGNILGKTVFEKAVMGIICVIQIINVLRIIIANKNVKRNYIINLIQREYKK